MTAANTVHGSAEAQPYPAGATRDEVERWWLNHAHEWMRWRCLDAAEVTLASAAADLRVLDLLAAHSEVAA